MEYLPRIIDKEIDKLMEIMGAVLIEGCKWCGKSTTGRYHSKSYIEFQNPDRKRDYEEILNTRPSMFLKGEKPRMFDEWQIYPVVWDSIRTDVDHTGLTGQYILTGSARPSEGATMHTGTGRISRITMRPMSLYESGESDGSVSFADIFNGKDIFGISKLSLEDIASSIVRGGWPASIKIKNDSKYEIANQYLKALVHEEVVNADGVERNSEKMTILLASLARNISSQVNISTIESDVKNSFDTDISRPTLSDYLLTLKKLYVLEDVNATNLNFRSKYAIRTKPKKYFVDPSIATAVLEMKPDDLMNDLYTFGLLFENLCIRDLKIYTQNYGNISFYRDEKDFEIDAILRTSSGKWGAIEIKLGAGRIPEAVENLKKFKENVDTKKCGEPAFLMVLTGAEYSYKRDDGIYVVSIGTLRD